mgnify:CR=1 FL=1
MDFIFLLFSILMINYLINSHIVFLAVTKKISKDFTDSILMRFLATIWIIICCFKLKQYKKIRYAFTLIDYRIILQRISFRRLFYLTKVRYKILFVILWIIYFIDIFMIFIIFSNLNKVEFYIRNILFCQIYIWFVEAFVLTFFSKKKGK